MVSLSTLTLRVLLPLSKCLIKVEGSSGFSLNTCLCGEGGIVEGEEEGEEEGEVEGESY